MTPSAPNIEPPVDLLRTALESQSTLTVNQHGRNFTLPLSVLKIATLRIRSGRVIVGDLAMAFEMAEPFVREVPPGEYDVLVSIWGLRSRFWPPSNWGADGPRVAYLALVLSHEPAVRYEFAASGDQPLDWQPTELGYDGFGVDVGPVGMIDAADLDPVRSFIDNCDDPVVFLHEGLAASSIRRGIAGCLTLPTEPPVAVPTCESGWGDGSYLSYWGFASNGDPTVLITDFDLPNKWGVE
ncbi:MAG TPA: DUF4241 domain-containing protein [Phycisphaerae bacterium]|nr:DUF4241 domain-containing protein [Phycisphaerales bacterium]HRX86339.1 DUF4241 domain-containing protein [Phycisphaerae bacterium]